MTTLHPRLIVADPNAAIVSYEQALSATLFERFVDGEGRVVHAAMAVGDGTFSLAQTVPEWGLFDPVTLGGTAEPGPSRCQ